jgi:Tol biopolymer transport system component
MDIRARSLLSAAVLAAMSFTVVPASAETTTPSPYQRAGINTLVSISDSGSQGNGLSADAWMSRDARFVTFFSDADDLVPGDDNFQGDVFLRDVQEGTLERASVSSEGAEANGMSMQPSISADGRYVAFVSYATNLVPSEDTNGTNTEVYVRDVVAGTTERITFNVDGGPSTGASLGPEISPDGRYVAYFSHASDLVPGDTNGRADVFLFDRSTKETKLVSVAPDGAQGDAISAFPNFSPDGRYLAFYSSATNLVEGDDNGYQDIFLADLESGAIELVSVSSDEAQGNYNSFSPVIGVSRDARFVAFQSGASNLVPADTNGLSRALDGYDIFVRDRELGRTERISVASSGAELMKSTGVSISNDGRYVTFSVLKEGSDPTDFNAPSDSYVHDRLTGFSELVSATSKGAAGTGNSENAKLSGDGRFVVFQSSAGDLVPGDSNELPDIVLRDRGIDMSVLDGKLRRRPGGWDIAGRATFSGVRLAETEDPAGDALGGSALGQELVGASISFRPEAADYLIKFDVASLPSATVAPPEAGGSVAGAPGLVYGLGFTLNGERWEVRSLSVAATDSSASAPGFFLYHCDTICTRTVALDGGVGTVAPDVRVSLPAPVLGLGPGESFTGVTAFTGIGEAAPGALTVLDDVQLDDLTMPDMRVEIGFAPADAPPDEVVYDVTTTFLGGEYRGAPEVLPPSGLSTWARACLGDACGAPLKMALHP